LFAAKPGAILEGPGFLASWSPVTIEGAEIGKVAIAVSTTRLTETRSTLSTVSLITLAGGALVIMFGVLVLLYFTRAVAVRDAQLNDHAANLERRVEQRTCELDERNRGMRIVLDNVAQGFISIDPNGEMAAERSAIVDQWFGKQVGTLADLVRSHSPDFAAWLEVSLAMIRDGFMPLEVCLIQMPRELTANGRSFSVAYSPIMSGSELERLLVIISDVTEQLGRERAERDQRELITVFQRIGSDRHACSDFLEEAAGLIAQLKLPAERVVHDRALHTLKGNAGMFGFERFGEVCHVIEGELREAGDAGVTDDQRDRLVDAWDHVVRTVKSLFGDDTRDVVQIDRTELDDTVARIRSGIGTSDLAQILATWADEPVVRRFERLGQQASVLARRLGKGEIDMSERRPLGARVGRDGSRSSQRDRSRCRIRRRASAHA
jgi:two-component system, chemotaxis family, sensor kinase CheA